MSEHPGEDTVRVTYELTYDEFVEAATGTPPRSGRRKMVWGTVGWLLFAALGVLLIVLLRSGPGGGSGDADGESEPPVVKPMGYRVAVALGPVGLFSALMCALVLLQVRRPLPKPWEQPQPGTPAARQGTRGSRIGWFVFIALGVVFFTLINVGLLLPRGAQLGVPAWELPSLSDPDVFLPIAACLLLVLPVLILSAALSGRTLRKSWDAQRGLRLPNAVEASDGGLVWSDPSDRSELRWAHFEGFRETANLLILYASPLFIRAVPKRAFASPADLDRFKALLQNHVREGQFLAPLEAVGFAVVPVRPPANDGPSGVARGADPTAAGAAVTPGATTERGA